MDDQVREEGKVSKEVTRYAPRLALKGKQATAEFSKFAGILSAALSQHHLSGFEIAQLEFHHLH